MTVYNVFSIALPVCIITGKVCFDLTTVAVGIVAVSNQILFFGECLH